MSSTSAPGSFLKTTRSHHAGQRASLRSSVPGMYLYVGRKPMMPSRKAFRLGNWPSSSWSCWSQASGRPGGCSLPSRGRSSRELKSPKITEKWWKAIVNWDFRWNPGLKGLTFFVPLVWPWNASDRIDARFWFRANIAVGPDARWTLAKHIESSPSLKRTQTQPLLPHRPSRPVFTRSQSRSLKYGTRSLWMYTKIARPTIPKAQAFSKCGPSLLMTRSMRSSNTAWRCSSPAVFITDDLGPSFTCSCTPMT
mmetsp:Transcript_102007/g.288861  ORF Transcript_102007/g.288861 Transcript_102007/m.288861 type:complete len:252 (+) Transcript_102007:191-946(+)